MNVLMICTEKLPVPPVLGGAIQTYIAGILPHLRHAHRITVLGVQHETLPNEETIDGIHYVRVPGSVFDTYCNHVVQYVRDHTFDLIHIFNRPRLVLPIRQVAPHAKITLSMHNDMFQLTKINRKEGEEVVRQVSAIVTISNYIGQVIRELYPEAEGKLRTIYSGVDSERFLPGNHPNMASIRKQLRQTNGIDQKTVILYAGRLSPNKGVDKLIQALPELAKRFNDLALVIVGSKWFSEEGTTDYIAYVRSLAKRLPVPVVATGFVPPNEIQNWFAAADLFVCTSQWQEPLARVHYEAMAAGLPIVTTARGGNAEVIAPNENGIVVEKPEDPQDFIEKMTHVLSNRTLMKKMGENGRKLATSLYRWERVASDVLHVWQHVEQTDLSPIQATVSVEEMVEQVVEKQPTEPVLQPSQPIQEEVVLNKKRKKTFVWAITT